MAYNKANSGSLYNNNYKQKDDQPDLTGTLYLDASFLQEMIEATEVGELVAVSVSGWRSTLPSGDPVINLRVKKPWKKEDKPKAEPKPKPEPEIDDEELPF
jgi:hypothetical protein